MQKAPTYNQEQVEKLLGEVLEKDKILLHCGSHLYVGSSTPPSSQGCKHCWEAYYWYMIASTPPHLRQERLEMLEMSLNHAVEMVEDGTFDFEPLARPEIITEHIDD